MLHTHRPLSVSVMLLRPSLSSLSSFALSQLSSEPFTMAPAVVARRFMAQLQLLYRKCTVSCFFMWSGAGMAGSRLKRSRSTDGHSSGAPGSCPVLKKNANSSCLLYHSGSRKDSLLDLYHCKLSSKQIVRRCDECTATGLCFFFFFSTVALENHLLTNRSADCDDLLFPWWLSCNYTVCGQCDRLAVT